MKNSTLLFIVITAFSLFSCIKEETDRATKENTVFNTVVSNKFDRSVEDAIMDLEYVIDDLYPMTRTSERKAIGDIQTVRGRDVLQGTRSDSIADSLIPENAYYFVNFENDGFAVLGADTRLENVYIITEQGSISPDIFSKIVTSGNTFSDNIEDYYSKELDDYLVGISLEESPLGYTSDSFIANMLTNAFCSGLVTSLSDDAVLITTTGPDELLSTKRVTKKRIHALMTTKWSQKYPFDMEAPNGVAGCIPVAMGQILKYHEYPKNGITLKSKRDMSRRTYYWSDLDYIWSWHNGTFYKDTLTNSLANCAMAGKFIKHIGRLCGASYFVLPGDGSNATFAWPVEARNFLRDEAGYPNVDIKRKKLDLNVLQKMLEDDCPLFYSSIPNWNIPAAHGWIMDGYYEYNDIYYYRRLINNSFYSYWEVSFNHKLVHCNWGWGGNADGYYSMSCLDPTDGALFKDDVDKDPNMKDKATDDKKSDQYTWFIRWIYYTNPNK